MKQDPLEQQMRELTWRRPLNAAEQARLDQWLRAHPEARTDWEADAALSAALSRLPESPAPSNLTARVMDAIEREDLATAGARKTNWFGWLRSLGWVPRTAVVVAVLGGGVFWYQGHQRQAEQAEALSTLATVTEVSPLPSREVLENFEVIMRIHPAPMADMELLSMSRQLAEFNQ